MNVKILIITHNSFTYDAFKIPNKVGQNLPCMTYSSSCSFAPIISSDWNASSPIEKI
jgi:hypothetical protein